MNIQLLTEKRRDIVLVMAVLMSCACSSTTSRQTTATKVLEVKAEKTQEQKVTKTAGERLTTKQTIPDASYKDTIVEVLPQFFQETPQSRAVTAGSKFYANANYCEFIRRYRLRTNADFNSAINLFKYRAYYMGAQRIVFVESDVLTNTLGRDVEMIIHPSLPKESATSIIVGDLYECPTSRAATY
jgi:hypothetical protein